MPSTIQHSIAFLACYGAYYALCKDISSDFLDSLIGLVSALYLLAQFAVAKAKVEE